MSEVRGHSFPKWGPRGPFRVYSWAQAAVTVTGMTVALVLMVGEIWGPPLVLLAMMGVLAWRDRTGLPWWHRIGIGLRWLVRGWTGGRAWTPSEDAATPPLLEGVEVWGYDAGPGVMGVMTDRGRYLAAVRLSPVRDPWLMSPGDRDAAADEWARLVTSIPTETVDRLQVLTVVRTGGGDDVLADAGTASGPGFEVVKEIASFVAEQVRHTDTFCVIRLTHAASRDAEKHGGTDAVGRLLYSTLQHLGSQVSPESIEVEILAPSELTIVFGQVLDPEAWTAGWRPHDDDGLAVGDVEEDWSSVRVGRSRHRVLWMWQWPQRRMTAGFLGPVLTGQGRRVVSILVAPADSESHAQSLDFAFRRAETAVETAKGAKHRKQSELEALDRQLAEISEGHVPVRVLATVAVSAAAGDVDGLEDTVGTVRANAVAGACKVAAVSGNQLRALGRVLPLCRGLDGGLDS